MDATVLTLQDVRQVQEKETQEVKTSIGTLQDELRCRGIPILPFEEVQEHQRMTLRSLRPGIWRFTGPFLRFIFIFCVAFWGVTLLEEWGKYTAKKIPKWILSLPVFIVLFSALGAIFGSLAGESESILTWFYVPLGAFLITMMFSWAECKKAHFAEATSAWAMGRINTRGYGASNDVPFVPIHLRARVQEVSTIPNARLYVEYLQDDPFLVVIRGHGIVEKVYIGAWETNSHFDFI